jgi:hypothetical protein
LRFRQLPLALLSFCPRFKIPLCAGEQVTTLLRQLGAETVSLDMPFFNREQQAAPTN